jgi:ferritin-like protein
MADASQGLHEAVSDLSTLTRDVHRALVSLQEELEAVDWYRQRAEACSDGALRAVLEHNMREEIEHAAMVLEWIRRSDADFDEHLRTYLFTELPITEVEEAETGDAGGREPESASQPQAESASEPAQAPAAPSPGLTRETFTLGSLKASRRGGRS